MLTCYDFITKGLEILAVGFLGDDADQEGTLGGMGLLKIFGWSMVF